VKVSATQLANDSNAILDRVVQAGETVEIERHTFVKENGLWKIRTF
jgi:hypothetical protein